MKIQLQDAQLNQLDKGRLTDLLQASYLLNTTLEPEKVLGSLMKLTNKLLQVEASSLLLIDERSHRLFFKAVAGGKARKVKRLSIPLDRGIVGWVIQNKKPYIADDVESDPNWSQDIAKKLRFSTRSILCVPIMSRGRLVGALEAINKSVGKKFSTADVALLTVLANQAALAVENSQLHKELETDNERIIEGLRLEHPIVGSSPQMKQLAEIIRKVAPTDSTLLIRGESGTGKELIAKAIHYNSPRCSKPLICVNCTLYSETLVESELFGHEKGSFTGAISRRIGRFEQADKGTVFLDEVGSISPGAQLKLLRVLEDMEFERLGGSETIKVDVRVIAATNENLEERIDNGRFRDDLYYRLKVIEVYAPPLREKKEDIPELVEYFLQEQAKRVGRAIKKISPKTMELLTSYNWPGNVRELRNSIERAIVLGSGDALLPKHLPIEIRTAPRKDLVGLTLEGAERDHIMHVLFITDGNKSRAAKMLGISRNRLDRKISAYGIKTQP